MQIGWGAGAKTASGEYLLKAAAEDRAFITEYPHKLRRRPFEETASGKCILEMMQKNDDSYHQLLQTLERYLDSFRVIPRDSLTSNLTQPFWVNGMLPGLDGMLLYTLVSSLKPKTYFEIGSGNSTKFVRRAICDNALNTRVISIDPHPRAEIDSICDEVIRMPCEDVPIDQYMGKIESGDIIFIDNSHISFPNSDVTVFFTEILPAIPSGVYYGIHDICLPFDYPQHNIDAFYNEQYLLVSYLLGGGGGDQIVFPGGYVSTALKFRSQIDSIFKHPELEGVATWADAFWMRKA